MANHALGHKGPTRIASSLTRCRFHGRRHERPQQVLTTHHDLTPKCPLPDLGAGTRDSPHPIYIYIISKNGPLGGEEPIGRGSGGMFDQGIERTGRKGRCRQQHPRCRRPGHLSGNCSKLDDIPPVSTIPWITTVAAPSPPFIPFLRTTMFPAASCCQGSPRSSANRFRKSRAAFSL